MESCRLLETKIYSTFLQRAQQFPCPSGQFFPMATVICHDTSDEGEKTLQLWWTDHMFPGPVAEFISCWYGFIVSWKPWANIRLLVDQDQYVSFPASCIFHDPLGTKLADLAPAQRSRLGKTRSQHRVKRKVAHKNHIELIIWVWVKTPGTLVDPKIAGKLMFIPQTAISPYGLTQASIKGDPQPG